MYVDDLEPIRLVVDAFCAQEVDCCTKTKLLKFLDKHSANFYMADDGRVYVLVRTHNDIPYFMDAITGGLFYTDGQHTTNEDRRIRSFIKCTPNKAKVKLIQQLKHAESSGE